MITNNLSADMQRRRKAVLKWRGLEEETLKESLDLLHSALSAEQWSELSHEMAMTGKQMLADRDNPLGAAFNSTAERIYQARRQQVRPSW